ncbi:MAG: ABC transporter substrate-binding protein [Chloroflexi bacterium]|nr:ABC transporter substrate-binding protein [Chloroflexota bacterium]MYF81362.1 ABC transporter substrate-binding protein [Chloroflexota bacterium]MYI04972.1 ABC transporter substrate-binding protein [Chloroflexota bacterium]
MRQLLVLAASVAAILALLTAACSSDDAPSEQAGTADRQAQAEQAQSQQTDASAQSDGAPGPLKIAFLGDLTGGLAEIGVEMRDGFLLAIKQINAAGGVFGQPVEFVIGDTNTDPTIAIEEARRMIEIEGAHVIVGAHSSTNSLAVAESITGPASIPQISPASSSPQLAVAADNDFLFRATLNDKVQGPALAQLVSEQGYTNVGVIYRDDAWGQGIADSFAEAFIERWAGQVVKVAVAPQQTTYLSEIQRSLQNEPEALVMLAYVPEGTIILRESIENDLYNRFVFGPTSRNPSLMEAIGPEHLGDMHGTAPGTAPGTESALLWESAFIEEYERPYGFPYTKQAYDAAVAFALAAEAAGSTDGAAIRDQLRRIGGAPGQVIVADVGSIRLGLEAARNGEDIDYEGAAQSLEWDENGDLARGFVGIWRFTAQGGIEDTGVIPYGE